MKKRPKKGETKTVVKEEVQNKEKKTDRKKQKGRTR